MDAREMLAREVNREVYHEVRELWKEHSIAEDRRDLAGLVATLTDDCVYEVFPGGTRWEGHAGAVRFYTELISAIPDIHFDLQNIAIEPLPRLLARHLRFFAHALRPDHDVLQKGK